ncbi:hypothetical protein OHS70_00875 [Streptomyces sp. NBC_00390]|uniref:hypothetical protein n=1 Tax=Streptomyces sp. NBC_00390 TaxID=2975736 RepID=UPI002E1D247E
MAASMFCALLGAVTALVVLSRIHNRQLSARSLDGTARDSAEPLRAAARREP